MPNVINKVVYGGNILIDLTHDTITADKILNGYTAHSKDGSILTGTCTYDADTKDATATAPFIAEGKTAYVDGIKVTGTASYNYNSETEELTVPSWAITLE